MRAAVKSLGLLLAGMLLCTAAAQAQYGPYSATRKMQGVTRRPAASSSSAPAARVCAIRSDGRRASGRTRSRVGGRHAVHRQRNNHRRTGCRAAKVSARTHREGGDTTRLGRRFNERRSRRRTKGIPTTARRGAQLLGRRRRANRRHCAARRSARRRARGRSRRQHGPEQRPHASADARDSRPAASATV